MTKEHSKAGSGQEASSVQTHTVAEMLWKGGAKSSCQENSSIQGEFKLCKTCVSKVCVNGSYGCGRQYWTLESEGNVFHEKTKGLGNCVKI